ncbi:MAG: TIGR03364 family FAD-dependent oxidoreductase [Candidatus Latescibacterota bacterium]|nr:TIGR03364 family FAD-dependent oxidoreductase [Candidatus Latescibacterota bacterium]
MEKKCDVAIVGGGILGIAHAFEAAKRGHSVVLFERCTQAQGASVRNFGLVWPIGQSPGIVYQRALRTRERWLDIAPKAKIWHRKTGSLHLAYASDEWDILCEFRDLAPTLGYKVELLNAQRTLATGEGIRPDGLRGSLWSENELCIDPRQAMIQLPIFLSTNYNVDLRYSTHVYAIDHPHVYTSQGTWEVQRSIVCNGDDFESLYPNIFRSSNITRCKLQMMRTSPQPENWRLGPTVAAGLTLRHYDSFKSCTALASYSNRIAKESPEYDQWGIHVLASQNGAGEILIGDSHEYEWQPSIFDQPLIDELILDYLKSFLVVPSLKITQRWHGIYAKLPGQSEFVAYPDEEVTIVNGVGGAGMTTAFGLAEEIFNQ